ncbi:MAG: branched-chain amino acid aminotransferase [Acidimicrobiia bacterium]
MTTASESSNAPAAPFGTVFTDHMTIARWADGVWDVPKLGPVEPLPLHPATHALHYGSACFEGLKAHRGVDGVVNIFRLDAHVRRLQQSADTLALPAPPEPMLRDMIIDVVRAGLADVPDAPGSLYLRPTLLGTEVNIGAAGHPSAEAILFVLASPVGDYFEGGMRPLSIVIETDQPRTTPQFGRVKSGANYAMALVPTMQARAALGVDQVLFAPGGIVQETGASNFLLIDGEQVVTPELTESFLHGVTRDSVLHIATDLGYQAEERTVTVDDVLAWAARPDAEAALSGTAAVIAGVGELVHAGERIKVGNGDIGSHTLRIRQALTDVQTGRAADTHGWLTPVAP